MTITILIPHYKTAELTAYTVSQLLKCKGGHKINIVVIDNNHGDGSTECLEPFLKDITIVNYPKDKLHSHGIAFDFILPLVNTEYFITIESDSFPLIKDWLDYYEDLANKGVDAAGSILKLSGGTYLHPAGAMYRTSDWKEANAFCDTIPYYYFPNMAMKEGFACHTMVHYDLFKEFIKSPEDYIELSKDYIPYSEKLAFEKLKHYAPVTGVFHNGMGNKQESVKTYGQRTILSEKDSLNFENQQKIIKRIGAEPGQFMSWWLAKMGKLVYEIPTETRWIDDKEGHQQEYTLNEAGFKHIWCGTSYLSMKGTSSNDIYEFKKKQIEEILKK